MGVVYQNTSAELPPESYDGRKVDYVGAFMPGAHEGRRRRSDRRSRDGAQVDGRRE